MRSRISSSSAQARRALITCAALAATLAPAASAAQQAALPSPAIAPQQPSAASPGSVSAQPAYGAAQPTYGAAQPTYGYMQPLPPDMEMQSSGMVLSGVLLMSFGATGLLAGGTMYRAATRPDIVFCVSDPCVQKPVDHATLAAVGMTTLVVSGLATLGGIPLLIIGAKKVPVKPEATALRPEVRVGPTGGALRWRF